MSSVSRHWSVEDEFDSSDYYPRLPRYSNINTNYYVTPQRYVTSVSDTYSPTVRQSSRMLVLPPISSRPQAKTYTKAIPHVAHQRLSHTSYTPRTYVPHYDAEDKVLGYRVPPSSHVVTATTYRPWLDEQPEYQYAPSAWEYRAPMYADTWAHTIPPPRRGRWRALLDEDDWSSEEITPYRSVVHYKNTPLPKSDFSYADRYASDIYNDSTSIVPTSYYLGHKDHIPIQTKRELSYSSPSYNKPRDPRDYYEDSSHARKYVVVPMRDVYHDIYNMSFYRKPMQTASIGPGHLACVRFAGSRFIQPRRPQRSYDLLTIPREVATLSMYGNMIAAVRDHRLVRVSIHPIRWREDEGSPKKKDRVIDISTYDIKPWKFPGTTHRIRRTEPRIVEITDPTSEFKPVRPQRKPKAETAKEETTPEVPKEEPETPKDEPVTEPEPSIPELPKEEPKPEPPKEEAKPEPPKEEVKPEPKKKKRSKPGAVEPSKEEPKEEIKPEALKEEAKPEPPKEEIKPEPPKEEPKPVPEPPKEEPKPEPPKEEAKAEPPKEEPKPESPKEESKPEPPKEEPKPEPVKEEPKPEPVKEEPKPEPVKEEPKPEPVKEEHKPEPVKEEPKPVPVTEEPKPEPQVEAPKEEATPATEVPATEEQEPEAEAPLAAAIRRKSAFDEDPTWLEAMNEETPEEPIQEEPETKQPETTTTNHVEEPEAVPLPDPEEVAAARRKSVFEEDPTWLQEETSHEETKHVEDIPDTTPAVDEEPQDTETPETKAARRKAAFDEDSSWLNEDEDAPVPETPATKAARRKGAFDEDPSWLDQDEDTPVPETPATKAARRKGAFDEDPSWLAEESGEGDAANSNVSIVIADPEGGKVATEAAKAAADKAETQPDGSKSPSRVAQIQESTDAVEAGQQQD